MRIVLKRDWDVQIARPLNGETPRGHYSGRNLELNMLANEILRGKKGSILISGYRGVGKTSLVYKSLWNVLSKKREVIIVFLNATQLESGFYTEINENKKIDPRKIIENLIRGLFITISKDDSINNELEEKIKDLYKKATASSFGKSEEFKNQKSLTQEKANELYIDFSLEKTQLIYVSSWILSTALQFSQIFPYDILNKLAPLIVAFPAPLFINLMYKKSIISRNKEFSEKDIDIMYQYDASLNNLEFDLEDMHRKIENSNLKLIYVIDELDKLDINIIEEIMNYFKNLFNLSEALFIFIGGEELYNYDSIINQKNKDPDILRNKNYTFFTAKYFLSRPLWPDLQNYFKDIIYSEETNNELELEELERMLCFDARNDFFDLKKYIRHKITDFDNSTDMPIIALELSHRDKIKSKLHKALTILFEEKYMIKGHLNWRENEMLSRTLFDYIHRIYLSKIGDTFEDPKEDNSCSELLRDFNKLLYRLGVLEIVSLVSKENFPNLPASLYTYKYNGEFSNEPPASIDRPTEFENKFLMRYEILSVYSLVLLNALKQSNGIIKTDAGETYNLDKLKSVEYLDPGIYNILKDLNKDYMILKNEAYSYCKTRDVTETNISALGDRLIHLKSNLENYISKIIQTARPECNFELKRLRDNNNYFSLLNDSSRPLFKDCKILVNSDLSKQIIFIKNLDSIEKNIIKNIASEITGSTISYIVVAISEKKIKQKSKEICVILTESPENLGKSLDELMDAIKSF